MELQAGCEVVSTRCGAEPYPAECLAGLGVEEVECACAGESVAWLTSAAAVSDCLVSEHPLHTLCRHRPVRVAEEAVEERADRHLAPHLAPLFSPLHSSHLHSSHRGLPNPLRRASATACSSMLGMLDSVLKDVNLLLTKSESGCLLSDLCDEQVRRAGATSGANETAGMHARRASPP